MVLLWVTRTWRCNARGLCSICKQRLWLSLKLRSGFWFSFLMFGPLGGAAIPVEQSNGSEGTDLCKVLRSCSALCQVLIDVPRDCDFVAFEVAAYRAFGSNCWRIGKGFSRLHSSIAVVPLRVRA